MKISTRPEYGCLCLVMIWMAEVCVCKINLARSTGANSVLEMIAAEPLITKFKMNVWISSINVTLRTTPSLAYALCCGVTTSDRVRRYHIVSNRIDLTLNCQIYGRVVVELISQNQSNKVKKKY